MARGQPGSHAPLWGAARSPGSLLFLLRGGAGSLLTGSACRRTIAGAVPADWREKRDRLLFPVVPVRYAVVHTSAACSFSPDLPFLRLTRVRGSVQSRHVGAIPDLLGDCLRCPRRTWLAGNRNLHRDMACASHWVYPRGHFAVSFCDRTGHALLHPHTGHLQRRHQNQVRPSLPPHRSPTCLRIWKC